MADMNLSGLVIWMIFPYVSVAVFLMGMIWKYEEDTKKKRVPMMNHITMITMLIMNGILLVGLFYSEGVHWLGWYRDFLTFQPDANAIMPSSGMQQIQVPMFFIGLVMLPFSIYMPSLASPFKRVKQIRRIVKNAI
ncbi:hypothetical protein ACGTN9_15330 [Halobacillus sp. MO56]